MITLGRESIPLNKGRRVVWYPDAIPIPLSPAHVRTSSKRKFEREQDD